MDNKEQIKKAIEASFDGQIKGLYQVLSQNILSTGNDADQLEDAKDKLLKGLVHANKVKSTALSSIESD